MSKQLLTVLLFALFATFSVVKAEKNVDAVESSVINGGVVVYLGVSDPVAFAKLKLNDKILVQGLDSNTSKVKAARKYLNKRGLYGKITVAHFVVSPS